MKNPMLVPCPGCGAEPGKPCRGTGVKVHVARRQLLEKTADDLLSSKSARNGLSIGLNVAKILLRIATRGRAGMHDSEDEACGCGKCCSMLARGLVAHMEGVMTSESDQQAP